MDVDHDKEQVYIGWLRQAASRPVVKDESYDHAWEVARTAATLLKERYGVSRVRVFGSLLYEGRFHRGSDIDLAVEGLKIDDYWKALAEVLFLDDHIQVEIVDRSICRPEIWDVVEHEGVDV